MKLNISMVFLLCCSLQMAASHLPLRQFTFENIGRIYRYSRQLIFGNPQMHIVYDIPFDPYQSDRLTDSFQKTYGYRGENLVHALGAGYSMKQLKYFNAVS